tara:strand:- start:5065 stop:6273 length:1209 start_codon:yes stop_codon:yes gene_type:complete
MEESKLKYRVLTSLLKLKRYCEVENFKGWDPYDGLNSKVFQFFPFKYWDIARLIWIQAFKRSHINFRKLLLVPKMYNSKGIGLFLSGYCNLFELAKNGNNDFGTKEEILSKINELVDLLDQLKNTNFSGACWGYNFPWQSRRLFLFPKDTPTVVATSFCVEALFKAYKITKNENIKSLALSSADFIMKDLNRTPHNSGFLFSYSPFKGNDTVYNASLLGAKTLSLCYKFSGNELYKKTAKLAVAAACDGQLNDGSWVYGLLKTQSWIDSFHTGYNLDAIKTYQDCTGDNEFQKNLDAGFNFYIKNFFEIEGVPKYYHNKKYPIDIHCPGQLFVTLSKLDEFKKNKKLAQKVISWSIQKMQSNKGYFYYQIKRFISSRISYMRWSNAFMFNAITYFLKENEKS